MHTLQTAAHWSIIRMRLTRTVTAAATATPAAAATSIPAPEVAPGHPPDVPGRPPPWPGCADDAPGAEAGATAGCTMTRTMSFWPSSQCPGAPLMKQKKPGRSRRNVVAPSANAASGADVSQASKAGRSTSSTESLAYLKSAHVREKACIHLAIVSIYAVA